MLQDSENEATGGSGGARAGGGLWWWVGSVRPVSDCSNGYRDSNDHGCGINVGRADHDCGTDHDCGDIHDCGTDHDCGDIHDCGTDHDLGNHDDRGGDQHDTAGRGDRIRRR